MPVCACETNRRDTDAGSDTRVEERMWACVLQLEHELGAYALLHAESVLSAPNVKIAQLRAEIRRGETETDHESRDQRAHRDKLQDQLRERLAARNRTIRLAIRQMLAGNTKPAVQLGIGAEHRDFRHGAVHGPYHALIRPPHARLASQLDPIRPS